MPPDAGKLWGARDVARAVLGVGLKRGGCGPVLDVVEAPATRSLAGPHVLARGRRPVRHAAARLHRASGRQGPQPRDVPAAGVRPGRRRACTGRSGRAAAFTTRSRRRRAAAAGDRVPRRPARADSLGDRAAARERPRADAGVAHRGRALAHDDCAWRASACAGRRRRVRAHGRGPASASGARGAVRRSLRLLLAAPRLPGLSCPAARAGAGTRSTRPPLSASRDRRTSSSATSCRSCCRRCSRSSCQACAISGRTARPATTRSPARSCAIATRARRWRRRSGSSARASSR